MILRIGAKCIADAKTIHLLVGYRRRIQLAADEQGSLVN